MHNTIQNAHRRGTSLLYVTASMTVLIMLASLAVDFGRVSLVRSEMQRSADAAARAGCAALDSGKHATVRKQAEKFVDDNIVDGQATTFDRNADIQIGIWNTTTRTFTSVKNNQISTANAVRVYIRRGIGNDDSIKLGFASVMGWNSVKTQTSSIAWYKPGVAIDEPVPGTASPFLAGMPKGSKSSENHPNWNGTSRIEDVAGDASNWKQSPPIIGLNLNGGDELTFDNIAGTVKHDPSDTAYEPDGKISNIGHNVKKGMDQYSKSNYVNENGLSDAYAPINALMGVFLTDAAPDTTSYKNPPNLVFDTAISRDFARLEPKLQQIFFIGDGLRSDGTQQRFVVPAGATRLVLATWDFWEWNNNSGSRTIKIRRPGTIVTVQ